MTTAQAKPKSTSRWRWWEKFSLRARLVAIISFLLAAGLGIATAVTTTVASNYLVDQVDQKVQQALADLEAGGELASLASSPGSYYVTVRRPAGPPHLEIQWQGTAGDHGVPRIPAPNADSLAHPVGPYTVAARSADGHSRWRVVSTPIRYSGEKAVLYVALPLEEIQQNVRVLALTLGLCAATIVIFGALAADLLVRRALRPLRQIESTAAAIAGGDLARRVSSAPPSTEVGRLSASLNAMLGQIEHAFATREASEARMRQFVSDASHELRTPLATIRGYAELYRMGALDTTEKVDDTMSRIEDAAGRMGTLVGDLLALARLDEGRPLRQDAIDLVALARDSAQDLHALDHTRAVRVIGLDGNQPPATLVVTGDEERLRQVLANLIGNVAQHTPSGTPADIAVGTYGGSVILEVRDHGPGIDPKQVHRVFERFYRADSSRNRSLGGSGLGMAIVAAIVGAHGGSATVRTTAGGGLTVVVRLDEREYDDRSVAPPGLPT